MKKLMSMLMATLMVVSMGITGFAQENGIKVVLDGKNVAFNDAKPIEKEGRVMVPFATIFEEMGATVKYENKTIIANLGNKELKMKENSNTAELLTDGKSEIIEMKVPAFVENGRSYVPVSTISLGFGFDVYWDETAKTVNVINSQKLIDEINAKYNIYNKMISSEQVDMDTTYKTTMDGNLNMNIDKNLSGSETDMVLAAKANIEALSKGMNLNAKGSIQVDTTKSNLTDMMGEEESMLENVPFEIIMNTDEGKFYVNMPMTIEGDDSLKNTWMEFEIDSASAMAIEQLKSGIAGKTELTIGQMVYQIAWSMKDTLPTLGMDVYSYAKEMDKIYELLIADDLFKTSTEGNTTVYTVEMNKTQIIARVLKIYGIDSNNAEMKEILDMISKLDYKMIVKENNGKTIDIAMDMNMSMMVGEEKIEMMMSVTGDEKNADMKMTMAIGNTKFDLDFKSVSVETKQTVQSAPPANATIVDLTQAINTAVTSASDIAVIGGADGPTITEETEEVKEVA